jgi:hypothetical protein
MSGCNWAKPTCFRCGKAGHLANECRSSTMGCFNNGEKGHINTQCQESKKAKTGGKVFSFSGVELDTPNNFLGRKFFKWRRVVRLRF